MLLRLRQALKGLNTGRLVDRTHRESGPLDRTSVLVQELTPEYVASALMQAASGRMGDLHQIYAKMYATDAHYKGCVRSVQSALSIYPVRVSVSKSKTPLAFEAAKLVEDTLAMLPLRRLIRSMVLAHVTGLRIYQNEYAIAPDSTGAPRAMLVGKRLVPPALYMMDMRRDSKTYGQLALKDPEKAEGKLLSSYPVGAFSWVDDGEEDGFYDLGGVGRACLFWYLAKYCNAKWWAEFNELYGEPVRVGYYDEASGEKTKTELRTFLRQLSRASWAMLPRDAELQFIETQKAGTIKTHQDFIDLANNEMSKAIVGQIGTMGRDKYGSYGETGVLNNVRFEIVASIASLIEESLQDDVRYLCRMNLDLEFPEADLPRVFIVVPNPEEKIMKADLIVKARTFMTIPLQWARDELGIPEPDPDEDVIEISTMQTAQQNGNAEKEGAAIPDREQGQPAPESEPGRDTSRRGAERGKQTG